MEIFVFSSETVTNIWAGIGAHMWAVSDTGNPSTLRSRLTKAKNMRVGSFSGVFHIQAVTAFSPTKIDPEDWEILMNELAV